MIKNPFNAGDPRDTHLIPALGRSPGEGNGDPLIHSSILAWEIPRTEEPGGLLQAMGLQRVRHH